jgi:hypothetical protein
VNEPGSEHEDSPDPGDGEGEGGATTPQIQKDAAGQDPQHRDGQDVDHALDHDKRYIIYQ